MKKVITTERQPIKLWLDEMDAGAFDQARNLANLPFVFKQIALMPIRGTACPSAGDGLGGDGGSQRGRC